MNNLKMQILGTLVIIAILVIKCSKAEDLSGQYSQAVKLYYQNQRVEALNILQNVYEADPDFKDTRMLVGKILYYERDFKNASRFFSEEKEKNTNSLHGSIWLIKAAFALGEDPMKILSEISNVLEKDDSNLEILFIRGRLNEKIGNIQEAISSYNRIVALSGTVGLAHERLSNIYSNAELEERASEHSKIAHKILKSVAEQ